MLYLFSFNVYTKEYFLELLYYGHTKIYYCIYTFISGFYASFGFNAQSSFVFIHFRGCHCHCWSSFTMKQCSGEVWPRSFPPPPPPPSPTLNTDQRLTTALLSVSAVSAALGGRIQRHTVANSISTTSTAKLQSFLHMI